MTYLTTVTSKYLFKLKSKLLLNSIHNLVWYMYIWLNLASIYSLAILIFHSIRCQHLFHFGYPTVRWLQPSPPNQDLCKFVNLGRLWMLTMDMISDTFWIQVSCALLWSLTILRKYIFEKSSTRFLFPSLNVCTNVTNYLKPWGCDLLNHFHT